jgi:hypothetical protein
VNPVKFVKAKLKQWLGITRLQAQRDKLLASYKYVAPGHFYSPIVSVDEYLRDEAKNVAGPQSALLGIELNTEVQLEILKELSRVWEPDLFKSKPEPGHRYYLPNPSFGASDAFFVQAMICHFRPKRLIEVGSGFSSCAILDANERYCQNQIEITFIEPFPELLHSLVEAPDLARQSLLPSRLQDISFETFSALEAGDILFIDSTHVSKTNSDVNYLFFEILPRLQAGVVVHIHDIFHAFEYPRDWILEGRSWNEAYVLRAFLQYNQAFEILLFNNYLQTIHADIYREFLPGLDMSGGSLWLRVK